MRRNIIFAAIALALIFAAGVAAWQVYLPIQEDNESVQSYTDLRQYTHRLKMTITSEQASDGTPEPKQPSAEESQPDTPTEPTAPQVDFDALKAINPEIVGWLTIDGTNIDYPIAQHSDNDYYLHHLFTGEWNSSGCLFMDCRNEPDFSDRHTIIYGHHMDNGTMFQNLMLYKSQEFYDQHPTAQLVTPEGSYTVEFFAGYVASVEDNAWQVAFATKKEFADWLSAAKGRSLFASPISPTAIDRIITLSTCSYEFYNARFVVHGVIWSRQ